MQQASCRLQADLVEGQVQPDPGSVLSYHVPAKLRIKNRNRVRWGPIHRCVA